MENESKLPFKVGELAEAMSFQTGFRGAWFRCKVRQFTYRKGDSCFLEYYDFPDEKLKCTKLYQLPPRYTGKGKQKNRELMLRPPYPTIYKENQITHVSDITEVGLIVDDVWKVGDLVDWWTTGCYWSGRIIQLLGDGKAQVELKPPPLGEGATYEVLLQDLRPSLDWSLQHGWTVPTQEGDPSRACARIINPMNQDFPVMDTNNAGQETGQTGSSVKKSLSSQISSNSVAVSDESKSTATMETASKEVIDAQEKNIMRSDSWVSGKRKTSGEASDSGQITSAGEVGGAREKVTLRSMHSDSIEAAALDLEEYLLKVKWLKSILLKGVSSSDAPKPQWEFVSEPK
ncbi:hypothetical protein ACJIZ3_017036 [Penstemon smallii]|uniref:Agenet domain-containing protein n=1 Tax=Penstemon smallii TaxID=265156 RepID=A0ABD3SUG0_9LAMI